MSASIHLDELIGICDEISVLSKVGLPLEKSFSDRRKCSLNERLQKMSQELEKGTSLSDLIRRDPDFPPFYATVIEAGLASGNLSGILNTVVVSARQIREIRLFIYRAILYPLILFTLLWFVFIGVFLFLVPLYFSFSESIDIHYFPVQLVEWLKGNPYFNVLLIFGPPVLMGMVYLYWGRCMKRNNIFSSSRSLFRFVPLLGTVIKELQKVVFTRNLSLLIEASVPLDQAISLASQSCCVNEKDYFRLIQWVKGTDGPHLSRGLQIVAENAQLRANLAQNRCETFLPALTTILVALVLGFAYILVIICPYIQILYQLGNPFI